MKHEKIKVAMITNHFGITGIGTVIMNYCKALDKDKFDLTIIAGIPIAEQYKREAKEYGIRIIVLPSRHDAPQKHYVALYKALKVGHYDIVHDHGSSPMMAIELTLARLARVKIRIAHCHSKVQNKKWKYKVLGTIFRHNYTKGLACSELAGDWLFQKGNFQVLTNGFDTKNFRYNAEGRKKIRRQLNIDGCYIIGHVGRFNEQKNQPFLLDVFKEVAIKRSDTKLLFVGTGPDFEKVQELVSIHPNKDRIILYGESSEMASLYSAMDVFVFPSKSEGLGLAAVEAQISGLSCIVSDEVPKEIVVSDNVTFISLNEPVSTWANVIVNDFAPQKNREDFYSNNQLLISNYEMSHCIESLDTIYRQMVDEL